MTLLLLLFACGSGPVAHPTPVLPPAHAALGVQLISTPDFRDEFTAKRDRPRLYNFWATWCGPCVEELPRLKQFATDHPDMELVLVSIDYRNQMMSDVKPFIQRHDLEMFRTFVLDESDPSVALPAIMGDWPDVVPVTTFVSADGKRGELHVGEVSGRDLTAGLAAAR